MASGNGIQGLLNSGIPWFPTFPGREACPRNLLGRHRQKVLHAFGIMSLDNLTASDIRVQRAARRQIVLKKQTPGNWHKNLNGSVAKEAGIQLVGQNLMKQVQNISFSNHQYFCRRFSPRSASYWPSVRAYCPVLHIHYTPFYTKVQINCLSAVLCSDWGIQRTSGVIENQTNLVRNRFLVRLA